jgi:hypothetical protein
LGIMTPLSRLYEPLMNANAHEWVMGMLDL